MSNHSSNFIAILALFAFGCQTCVALSCDKIDQCKCEMSDGSGIINLRSLGNQGDGSQEPAFVVSGDFGWLYKFNPCYGWSSTRFTNLAVLQSSSFNASNEHSIGSQTSERFTYSPSSGVSIKYEDDPSLPFRNSSVLLICNTGITNHIFEFLGELITTEYELLLNGPCACPGKCDDNGIIVPTTATEATSITTTSTSPPDQTTTAAPEEPGNDNSVSSFDWDHMGNVLTGLIFHDFILVFVIVLVVVILRYAFGYDCCSKQPHKSLILSEA